MEKRGFVFGELGKIIIAMVILITVLLIIFLFKDKSNELIEFLKGLVRFGV